MENKKIGLALSGGGQRAAAFHLGVLRTLYDKNILDNINVISAISGGSIIAGYYLLNKDNFFKFYNSLSEKLELNLESKIIHNLIFTWPVIILLVLLLIVSYSLFILDFHLVLILIIPIFFLVQHLFKIFPTGKSLQNIYNKNFYYNKFLKHLPDTPRIIFNSTNLQTGTLMTFSKNEINDSSYLYKYGHIPQFNIDDIPISFIVAASTGFAPLISPMKFDKKHFIDYETINEKKIVPELVDGGIYDNQGIYKLNKENLDALICSDASAPYDRDIYTSGNPFGLLMRTITILMKRIRSFQFVKSIYESPSIFEVAYFSIDWQYDICLTNFAQLALENKIRENILENHSIPSELLNWSNDDNKSYNTSQIIEFLKKKINYDKIIETGLTINQIKSISKISTRLRGLKKEEITNLVNHGKILTELQLNLYCPDLLP